MPLILGANSVSGGYEVDNSLRFDSGSSDSLTKTTTTPDNRDKLTLSAWFKISSSSTSQEIFGFYGSNDYFTVRASNSNRIDVILYDGSAISRLITTQLLRDFSAWYHIVVVVDSANATADDRVKIYLNGNQITSFSTRTNPSQNQDFILSTLTTTGIGINTDQVGGVSRFNGYISEAFYIDNQALDPTSFGEFDEDSGIWKPIAYTGTFGTAGFYLEFKDSSALGDDTSGNGNDFTVNNLTSIDQTTDTPSNNFATLNSLNIDPALSYTFSNGNLDVSIAESGGEGMTSSTLSVSQGKWYWECKLVTSSAHGRFGVVPTSIGATGNPGEFGIAWQMNDATMQLVNTIVSGSWGSNPSNNDILMFALDCDNQAFYFGVNGTWRNSGSPTSGASKTGGVDYSGESTLTSDYLTIGFGGNFFGGGGVQLGQYNFGNPSFTISSGNSDANGYGNFEYSVPSGYYALNSKNLAEFG